ncbi:MAG: hypothetical protein ABF289_15850 [Clostridiales bacterium]
MDFNGLNKSQNPDKSTNEKDKIESLNVEVAEVDDKNDPESNKKKDTETDSMGSEIELTNFVESVGDYEISGVTCGIDVSK